ncbi:MAG: orotate phosphoribosyltransferase [Nanoarchaeota archaeon]|nr:orotate phosphoribosyltransferase [Nanoarchaeota archaeon]
MKEIARILLDIKAIKFSPDKPFTYVSGIKSPIYTDNRLLISYPEQRKRIISAFKELVEKNKLQPDVIAGTASAGIPFASWLAEALDLPMVYVRKATKEYGAAKRIEGIPPKGKKVMLVEDLISTGGSSLSAIEALREAGAKVEHCVAIFSYGMQKAVDGFKDAGITLHHLTGFEEVIDEAIAAGYMKEADKRIVLSWAKDPKGWKP